MSAPESGSGIGPLLDHAPVWAADQGPLGEVVLSSRVRLARNLSSLPFPTRSTRDQQGLVVSRVRAAAEHIAALADAAFFDVEALDDTARELLIERRLISRDLAAGDRRRGVLVGTGEGLSVMVNEEDHLRLQGVVSGFRLGEALETVVGVDDVLDAHLEYAFSQRLGYLTACPTNVGTGIRASVLIHVPALSLVGEIRKVMQGATAMGLAVRGFYGEGSGVMGNFVQISNHTTLGQDENRIVGRLGEKVHAVLGSEQRARETVWSTARLQVEDKVYRAFGLLAQARSLRASEALNLASAVRFGLALELPGLCRPEVLNEILVFAQPGHVTALAGRDLTAEERRERRATYVRGRIRGEASNGAPPGDGNGNAFPSGRGNRS